MMPSSTAASAATNTSSIVAVPTNSSSNNNNNTNATTNINDNNNTTTSSSTPAEAHGLKSSHKKTADSDLKSSIIEFMRARPFLWNSKHPDYKDHKRREHEFQAFSCQIGHSIQEIKRVWHVLRTNFFRAHKLLLEKPHGAGSGGQNFENGEKLWKYYLAMVYILESTTNNDDSFKSDHSQPSLLIKSEHPISQQQQSQLHHQQPTPSRHTRNSKVLRESRATRGSPKEATTATTNNANNNNNNDLSITNNSRANNSSGSSKNNSSLFSSTRNRSLSSTLNDSISMDTDDDHLYARSLTSTLKKFDPTTKEIIKLKFQEIIVSYMQQQKSTSPSEDQ